jgi:hypothetical protein
MPSTHFTLLEAATVTGLPPSTIHKALHRGELQYSPSCEGPVIAEQLLVAWIKGAPRASNRHIAIS